MGFHISIASHTLIELTIDLLSGVLWVWVKVGTITRFSHLIQFCSELFNLELLRLVCMCVI